MLPEEWVAFFEAHRLTGREDQILPLTIMGFQRKQIAKRLKLKINTIHKHCDQLHKRLRVHDRLGLARVLFSFVIGHLRQQAAQEKRAGH